MIKNKPIQKMLFIIGAVFLFISFFVLSVLHWVYSNYGNLAFENVIFQLSMPSEGTDPSYFITFGLQCVLLPIVLLLLSLFLVSAQFSKMMKNRVSFQKTKVFYLPIGVILFSYSLFQVNETFQLKTYLSHQNELSNFVEENYVDPEKVKITFSSTKHNLIIINMESMENTFMEKDIGGLNSRNLIPELTALAEENVNFSQSDGVGGAYETAGSRNTISSLVSQMTGIPLKIPFEPLGMFKEKTLLPNAITWSDVLHNNGYQQTFLLGSNSDFSGKGDYFRQHGYDKIIDLVVLQDEKKLEVSTEGWGIKDYKLYELAKEELISLASSGKPFNLTMETIDTHTPNGFKCPKCDDQSPIQYENVVTCANKQAAEFIKWVQQQDFYANTTIVIIGDHPSMVADYSENLPKNYQRTAYHVLINPVVNTEYAKHRYFSKFDFFPTILVSLGAVIDGDRLALGTNLFSGKKTLIEEIGFDRFNSEIEKTSEFYNKKLLRK